jgi:hypothetical protein
MLKRFFGWIRGVLSEPDGSPSSTRVLMYIFSIFSIWLIARCFHHIFQIHDTTMLTIWLSNMPMLVGTLVGLIALPYGINKGTATFSDIANMVAAAKTNNISANLTGDFKAITGVVQKAPDASAPAAPAAPVQATGSAGIKG